MAKCPFRNDIKICLDCPYSDCIDDEEWLGYDPKSIGSRLKELREAAQITRREVAEKVGVIQRTVSKWENGETTPNEAHVMALEQLFPKLLDSD